MSFNITIQKNNSEKNRVNKDLDDLLSLDGTLKNGTSIVNPVIRVKANLATLKNANYATINSFGRKYFIVDIKSLTNNIVEITCHVDVISSFYNQYKTNSAIIKRQQDDWNLYVNDGAFLTYQYTQTVTKPFPNKFNNQEYVLIIAGSN